MKLDLEYLQSYPLSSACSGCYLLVPSNILCSLSTPLFLAEIHKFMNSSYMLYHALIPLSVSNQKHRCLRCLMLSPCPAKRLFCAKVTKIGLAQSIQPGNEPRGSAAAPWDVPRFTMIHQERRYPGDMMWRYSMISLQLKHRCRKPMMDTESRLSLANGPISNLIYYRLREHKTV